MTTRDELVLILEPESSGLDLIGAAARLGFGVQVFDHRPLSELGPAARKAVAAGSAAYLQVDTRSADTTTTAARELAARRRVTGVVPGFEYAVPVAATVAAALGLPGLDPEAANALREKDRMKARLAAAGVAVAKGVTLNSSRVPDSGSDFWRTVEFPAVVKPIDGSGSLLVRRVDAAADLKSYLESVRRGSIDSMGRPMGERLLLENYISGAEFSIEGYVTAEKVSVVAFTQKQLGPEPNFAEIGHIVDAPLPADERKALESTAVTAAEALGLSLGVFHLEVRLTTTGPVVLEIGARLAGDRIPALVAEVHGVDLAETLIQCHTGMPVTTRTRGRGDRVAASQFFTVDTPSVLPSPDRLVRRLTELDGCREAVITAPPGTLLMPAVDWRQRFGRMIVSAADRASLDTVLARAHRLVREAVTPQEIPD